MSNEWTKEQERVKAQFIRDRGQWKWDSMTQVWETILRLDSNAIESFVSFSSVPHKRNVLDAKLRELLCVAIDASITHLHVSGIRNHIRHALEVGATKGEVLEVLEICSSIGSHTLVEGATALAAQMKKQGVDVAAQPLTPEQEKVKEEFLAWGSDCWPEGFDLSLKFDAEYFEAFSGFMNVPRKSSYLDPKTKELVWLARDASPTTVYRPGIEQHVARAFELGATAEEIYAVFEIIAGLGVHSITVGVPILKELAEELGVTE